MPLLIVFCHVSALEKKCPVCLGLLDEEDEAIVLPKCSHKFHSSCILPWLQRVISAFHSVQSITHHTHYHDIFWH